MSESLEAAPGDVISETEHATTYQGATAATFEGTASVYSYIYIYIFEKSLVVLPCKNRESCSGLIAH